MDDPIHDVAHDGLSLIDMRYQGERIRFRRQFRTHVHQGAGSQMVRGQDGRHHADAFRVDHQFHQRRRIGTCVDVAKRGPQAAGILNGAGIEI